jgi:hypothetical protein
MPHSSRVLVIAALLSAGVACDSGRHSSAGFRLPQDGDAERGKLAFVELGCPSCSRNIRYGPAAADRSAAGACRPWRRGRPAVERCIPHDSDDLSVISARAVPEKSDHEHERRRFADAELCRQDDGTTDDRRGCIPAIALCRPQDGAGSRLSRILTPSGPGPMFRRHDAVQGARRAPAPRPKAP